MYKTKNTKKIFDICYNNIIKMSAKFLFIYFIRMGNKWFDTDARTDWWDEISMSSSTSIWERSEKWWLSTWNWVDVSKKRLSHVLLAEKSRKAIKEEEKKINGLDNKIELNAHRIQLDITQLNSFLAAFAETEINNNDLFQDFVLTIKSLWFIDDEWNANVNAFLTVYWNQDLLDQYIDNMSTTSTNDGTIDDDQNTKEIVNNDEDIMQIVKDKVAARDIIKNKLDEAYAKLMVLQMWYNKIDFLGWKIEEMKKNIEKLFRKGNEFQKKAEKISEKILDLISSGALEQRLYLWNEAHLEDSVLWENVDAQLKNIIDMYKNKEYVETHGLKLPKTILLFWDVNSWKNFAAKVLATEIWRDMYTINKQDICWGTFWDDPINALKWIFLTIAEKKKPCIIFLDEIDKILDIYKGSPYNEIVWNAILSHMLYVRDSDLDIITIWWITNKNNVDGDFLKYDNFGTQIFLPELDDDNRFKYFEILKGKYGSKNVEFADMQKDYIINMLSSYSKDVIKKLVDMAVESAVTRNIWLWWEVVIVEQADFDRASSILKESEKTKTKKYL